MPGKRRNRSAGPRIRPGSARERGNVWVPVGTNIKDSNEYWNKFKMTKSDSMFQEMEKKFQNLSARRRSFDHSLSFLTPSELASRSRRTRNSDLATFTRPYPSGSCYTVLTGDNSNFCITSNLHLHKKSIIPNRSRS